MVEREERGERAKADALGTPGLISPFRLKLKG
jgi:hypothetical protein